MMTLKQLWRLWTAAALMVGFAGCQPPRAPAHESNLPAVETTGETGGVSVRVPDQFAPGMSLYPFTGSLGTKRFHRAQCPEVSKIPAAKRVFLRGAGQAREQGMKPCPRCRPDEETPLP